MKKNTFTKVQLAKGEMHIYDFGSMQLHAYKTNDLIDDEVFVLVKNGKAVIIESPCFTDNIQELEQYLRDMDVAGILIAYHAAGGRFLPDAPKYATQNAVDYAATGAGHALISKFAGAFGAVFDSSVHKITHVLDEGQITIGGIEFLIRQTADAFDVEIPEIGAVYTHMLGHDCHSIVAGADHADAMIAQLNDYIRKDCALILTSHYTPEDLKDAEAKIAYLHTLKEIAANCSDAAAFKSAVQKQYPNYSGENYLDMTAGFFFAE